MTGGPPRVVTALSRCLGSAIVLFASGCALFGVYAQTHAQRAAELRTEGRPADAVAEYLLHIDERLARSGRDESENPYFYYLLIGDTYLETGDRERAKESYERARKEGVEKDLVADRYRRLAESFENANDLDGAITILREGRELDPEMLDFEIDRLHKKAIEAEDKASGTSDTTTPELP